MIYDLTSVLITIATASASIVAILGGFIASKLISISNDRTVAQEREHQINEELDLRRSIINRCEYENDEDDALNFIEDHIDVLFSKQTIESVYDKTEHPEISLDKLKPFWENALEYLKMFLRYRSTQEELNEDKIPTELAAALSEDEFGYKVTILLAKKYEQVIRNSYIADLCDELQELTLSQSPLIETKYTGSIFHYQKNQDCIADQEDQIRLLELEKKQLEEKIITLRKPRGMIPGLIIFAIFSLVCIVMPLVTSPFTTDNYKIFLEYKCISLGVFFIGLTTIFIYLIYLLKDNGGEINGTRRTS